MLIQNPLFHLGDVVATPAALNALQYGDRLLSSYVLSESCKVWVITEWDRSVTTILLPSEY